MMQSANTARTFVGGRAVSLAALAALLVVLASADAAMRSTSPGVRVAFDGRPLPRASVVGLGRLVEGLLGCATFPDAGVPVVSSARSHAEPATFAGTTAIVAAFGLFLLLDLPPPALG
ncbi:MAG: hypothetical protein KIT54_00320 [Phycisphaeraceae bacterium]|nr:hypothetical protein [Phycisphaeraceae bacterium]